MSLFTDSEMYSLSGSTGVPTGEEGAWVSAAAMPEARPDVQSRCSLAAGLFSMGCCALKACALAPRAYAGGREMSVCAEFSLVVRISSVRCFHALRGALYKVAEMLVPRNPGACTEGRAFCFRRRGGLGQLSCASSCPSSSWTPPMTRLSPLCPRHRWCLRG